MPAAERLRRAPQSQIQITFTLRVKDQFKKKITLTHTQKKNTTGWERSGRDKHTPHSQARERKELNGRAAAAAAQGP